MALPINEAPKYTCKLLSTKEVITYRPFLVKEEKIMLMAIEADDDEEVQRAITDTVQACVQTRNIDVSKLPIYDFEYLYLQIRAKSIGEIVKLKLKCPDDDKEVVDYDLNIQDIKLTTDKNHTNKIEFEKGYGVILREPTIQSYDSGKIKRTETEVAFKVVRDCIESIYKGDEVFDRNNISEEEIDEYINNLTQEQYTKLLNFFDTMPKIRHRIEYENPKTHKKFALVFNGAADFF